MSELKPASADPAATAAVSDPKRFRLIRELKHDRGVLACRFAADGRQVFAGAQDEFVHHWNLAELPTVDETLTTKPAAQKKSKTPEPEIPAGPAVPKQTLAGHDSWIQALALSADGSMLAAGDYVGRVTLRSTDQMNKPLAIEAHRGSVRSVSFSKDGTLLASAGNDGVVRVWSVADGREVLTLDEHGCHVYQTAFHPDGRSLISADLKGVIRDFDLPSGKLRRKLDASALYTYSEKYTVDVGGVRGLAFNADGSQLACAGAVGEKGIAHSGNARVLLFDWRSGKLQQTFRPEKEVIATAWGVRFHPDGYLIASGGSRTGGYVWFWRPEAETEFHLFNLSTRGPGFDLDLSPDARYIAIAHYDGAVRLYDMNGASIPAKS
jgi:WD40 repeat protein